MRDGQIEGTETAHHTRTSMRVKRVEHRRRIRNNILVVVGGFALCAVVVGLIVLITVGGGGRKVPEVLGLTFKDAKRKVQGAGLAIEIDPMQDSSVDYAKMKVENQDPKPGTKAEKDDLVTVRLKGLQDSPKLTKDVVPKRNPQPTVSQPQQEQQAQGAQTSTAAAPAAGRTICIDPGHSNRTGNEIDSATGLNVGDNSGAPGELETMWELALKTQTALQQAGYAVRLTKSSSQEYASLRQRADIGNSCSIMVRLHYDDTGFTGVMRAPQNAARCPEGDPSRITVIDSGVATESNRLAADFAGPLGLLVKDDTGGTSQGNATPPGHPTALIGSVLSKVPVVCIENKMSLVRDNPDGQNQVASEIVQGINAYFQGR